MEMRVGWLDHGWNGVEGLRVEMRAPQGLDFNSKRSVASEKPISSAAGNFGYQLPAAVLPALISKIHAILKSGHPF